MQVWLLAGLENEVVIVCTLVAMDFSMRCTWEVHVHLSKHLIKNAQDTMHDDFSCTSIVPVYLH